MSRVQQCPPTIVASPHHKPGSTSLSEGIFPNVLRSKHTLIQPTIKPAAYAAGFSPPQQ